jgi:hypothetical protein
MAGIALLRAVAGCETELLSTLLVNYRLEPPAHDPIVCSAQQRFTFLAQPHEALQLFTRQTFIFRKPQPEKIDLLTAAQEFEVQMGTRRMSGLPYMTNNITSIH